MRVFLPAVATFWSVFMVGTPLSVRADGYAGVVPEVSGEPRAQSAGQSKARPRKTKQARNGLPRVTWPGFQVLPSGVTRVFVQTSGPVKPMIERDGSTYKVSIPKALLPRGNARLALDTHYFDTPVGSVHLVALGKGRGVVLVLEMRAEAVPALRTEQTQNGFFTFVEFPAGSYLSAEPSR